MKHVLPIEKARPKFLTQAGPKCVQLGSLLSAGFQVPGGFCILASGYDVFVKENALQEKIHTFLKKVSSRSKPTHQKTETELLEWFRTASYPKELEKEILLAYRSLSTNAKNLPRVAVRSSGSQEDGLNASFAGQFESYLNVRGEQELLDQIKCCWARFWNTHSLYYQMDRCGTNGFSGIAILVQEMVAARLSGVLFSANPISGSSRQMVIEASWGLGEAIVGGEVKPDRFVVDLESGTVLEKTIQNKEIMVVPDLRKRKATRHTPVPRTQRSVACLTDKEIDTLVATGKKVHAHFGKPQDIEWAFDKKNLYLLQARPITTLPDTEKGPSRKKTFETESWHSEFDSSTASDTEWMSATIRDMLPGALSPLTISQMSALEYGFQKPHRELGLLPQLETNQNTNFLGFFYSRAHLNMSLIRSLIRKAPLVSSDNLERLLREEADSGKAKTWFSLRFARDLPNLFRIGFHALNIVRRFESAAEELISNGLRQHEEEQQRTTSPQDPEELLQWMDEIQKRRAEIYAMHITASEFGEVTFQLLKHFTRRLANDEYGKLASQLITGSSTPLFAKPIAELWGLAQKTRGSRKLQNCFSMPSVQSCWRRLRAERGQPVKNFRNDYQTFLRQYGYRSRYGAELMHPSWEDEPIFILSMVRIYSKLLLTLNPWEMEREQAQRRRNTLRRLESHLNPLSKRILHELLKQMQVLIPLRQNMRALSLIQAHLARRAARQIADHLVAGGSIETHRNVFFLTMEELHNMVRQGSPGGASGISVDRSEIQKRVKRRKTEYQQNLQVILPEKFHGRPKPFKQTAPHTNKKNEKRLRGIPASPGRITGQARRITAPVQEVRVQPGEILILPGMDPGWTPLFLAASAIVTDRGGILSHGSILAREYGIPAVISIGNATKIIQTGQVITVDGDRGEVWL